MAHPWDQLPDESAKAFAAFCHYRNLGPERTLVRAHELYRDIEPGSRNISRTTPPSYFTGWSTRFKWKERSHAWDQNIEAIKAEEIESAAVKAARKWAERFEKLREQEFEVGQTLVERAQEMLEYPLVQSVEKHGGKTVIVMPADWRPADAVAFMNAASKLVRLAVGTHTDLSATREVEQQVMKIGDREIRF